MRSASSLPVIVLGVVTLAVVRSLILQGSGPTSIYTLLDNADFQARMLPSSKVVVSTDSYELAYKQSFGFFDNILYSDWKIFQHLHQRLFPNHFRKSPDEYVADFPSNVWYGENFQEEFHCMHTQRIPADGSVDGAKFVCDPHRIAKKKDCLVYSVGSYGNTMFERGIKTEIGEHCEIHTFDVAASNHNGDFKTLVEAAGASFHFWGLGTKAQSEESKNNPAAVPMKTLKETLEILNHTNRMIDIFKIDCEGCEWHTYTEWLEAGDLRQILVETHRHPLPQAKEFFYTLHDAGYVIFSKESNYLWKYGVEFAFLKKLSTDFFINDSMYSKLPAA